MAVWIVRDCLFSASCIMRSIQFDVTIESEKDSEFWIIPAEIYQSIMKESAPVSNYTNEWMAARFSDVMRLIEQIMRKSLDKRVAEFLLEEMVMAFSMPSSHSGGGPAHHVSYGDMERVVLQICI